LMLVERKEQAVVSSRVVAEKFHKNHQHIMESIRNLTVENSTVKKLFINTNMRGMRRIAHTPKVLQILTV
jgi:phage regulator Rha-like protein